MIDHLSPREVAELRAALEAGEAWPRVLLDAFAEETRLRLGWDEARRESDLIGILGGGGGGSGGRGGDAADPAAALARAARWCVAHGLHLLSYEGAGPGEDPVEERRWFMAVG